MKLFSALDSTETEYQSNIIVVSCYVFILFIRHDGRRFTEMVTKSVAERKKKGIADRRNRYIHYCQWAHALKVPTVFHFA